MNESRDLLSARALLSEFEHDMASPSAVAKLSDGLSLLSDIVESGEAENQVARNLAGVYAGKAIAAVDATLAKPGEPSAEELGHWQELLTEFDRCGFESLVAAALSKLSKRRATRYVSQLTPGEKEVLLKKLEKEMGKGRT